MPEEVRSAIPDWVNEYQRRCLARVREVLTIHDLYASPEWDDKECLVRLEFTWDRQSMEIQISPRDVVLLVGEALFEAYLPQSFETEFGDIEEFAERLRRFLTEGGWSSPNEKVRWL